MVQNNLSDPDWKVVGLSILNNVADRKIISKAADKMVKNKAISEFPGISESRIRPQQTGHANSLQPFALIPPALISPAPRAAMRSARLRPRSATQCPAAARAGCARGPALRRNCQPANLYSARALLLVRWGEPGKSHNLYYTGDQIRLSQWILQDFNAWMCCQANSFFNSPPRVAERPFAKCLLSYCTRHHTCRPPSSALTSLAPGTNYSATRGS